MVLIRILFLTLIARPLARVISGADVIGIENLPKAGPAIIAANHNSHVDTLLLLTMFPVRLIPKLRPAAAADYFLKGPMIGWFSRHVVGIVPVERAKAGTGEDVLAPTREALAEGAIVFVFPEGTRGDASDEIGELKSGVARLAHDVPGTPVVPVWIEGAGRVLPKGAVVPVPMNCTVLIGAPLAWTGDRISFMLALRERLLALRAEAPPQRWR